MPPGRRTRPRTRPSTSCRDRRRRPRAAPHRSESRSSRATWAEGPRAREMPPVGEGRGAAQAHVRSDLQDQRVALPTAGADRGTAEAAAAATQLVDEGADDARARGPDRVPEGDGAAVDVDPVLVDAEHPDRVERDGCERLVDLPQVDVA